MTDRNPKKPANEAPRPTASKQARERRLAESLRSNLEKRKQQARQRRGEPAPAKPKGET